MSDRRVETLHEETFLGDMYLRLERLEAEVVRLRPTAPDATTDTTPTISHNGSTPAVIRWPAPRQLPPPEPVAEPAAVVPLTVAPVVPPGPPAFRGGPDIDLLRAALDASPHAVVAVDGRGLVRLWNAAAEQLFGWAAADVLGTPPPFLPAARREEHATCLRGTAPPGDQPTVRVNRRGDPVPVRSTATPSPCGGVVFTLRPETQTPPPSAVPTPDAADAGLVTLGRATAGAAHSLNNLLTAVRGFAGLLAERLEHAPDLADGRGLIRDILTAAEVGGETCRNLLNVAAPAPGTPDETDITRHVARYQSLLRRAAGPHVPLQFTLDRAAGVAQVPPAEFAQVLFNLVQDAAATGGPVSVTTAATEAAGERFAVLGVSGGRGNSDGLGRRITADILARHGGRLVADGPTLRAHFRQV